MRAGALDWLDYTEPDDEGDRGIYPHNWSPEMETTAAVLRLSDAHRDVALDLVLTATDTGEVLRLPGSMNSGYPIASGTNARPSRRRSASSAR